MTAPVCASVRRFVAVMLAAALPVVATGCGDEASSGTDAAVCAMPDATVSCRFRWRPCPPVAPAWDMGPECEDAPETSPPHYYESCELGGRYPVDVNCGVPVGAAVCVGYWTSTCRAAPDCPDGMTCAYQGHPVDPPAGQMGLCERTCVPGRGGDCRRCDMSCWDAVCVRTVGHSCSADCECWDWSDFGAHQGHCEAGRCMAAEGPPRATCGDPELVESCACTRGTCEPTPDGWGCCRLPDGTVASVVSPECS